MKKSRWISALSVALVLGLQSLPAMAAPMTPDQLLSRLASNPPSQGFTGKRTLNVWRLGGQKPLSATADITYADRNNYDLKITGPTDLRGVEFNMIKGVNSVYFPDEKLFLEQGGPNTSYMPERVILSLFPQKIDLIRKNYDVQIVKENEGIAGNLAYVVDFIPKGSFVDSEKRKMPLVPRRRYWLESETLHVIKEARYWDLFAKDGNRQEAQGPYSEASYSTFSKTPNPAIPAVKPVGQVNKVNLSGTQSKNSFLTYKTVAEAEKREGIKISLPTQPPDGFELKDIQVFTLFGARIQVLNYTDGLNDMMITIRPQQNAFVTLMAGTFSLNLIKKITDLSHQAPNNYYSNNNDKYIAVVFGDLHPEILERVATTLSY